MCIYLHTFHMEKLNGQYLSVSYLFLLVVGTRTVVSVQASVSKRCKSIIPER